MFFIPVPVKTLFSDFPTEISMYTISDTHSCEGFFDMDEGYIIFPIDDCPEIKQGSKIVSSDGSVFIAKKIESGGCTSIADAIVVHI